MSSTGSLVDEARALAAQLVSPTPPADPWVVYRRLNEISPVTRVDALFVATGHAPVSEVLKSHRFGQGPPEHNRIRLDPRFPTSSFLQAISHSAVMADPPVHTRLRRFLNPIFSAQAIKDVEPYLIGLVDVLLDRLADLGTVDLKADFAARIPMNVVGELVGLPEEDRDQLFAWGHILERGSTPFVTDDELRVVDAATDELVVYIGDLFRSRREKPRGDKLTLLVEATIAEGMTAEEFTSHLIALIVAGTQTTVHMITSGIVALHENPDELARFRGDPSLDATACDEILRYYPPLHTAFPRLAMQDVELDDVTVPAGSRVFPFVAAANRDARVFDDPDRLRLDRDTGNPAHLSFGHGIHLCVGRLLARAEGRVALRRLVERFPALQVDLDAAEPWATAMARGHVRVPAVVNG